MFASYTRIQARFKEIEEVFSVNITSFFKEVQKRAKTDEQAIEEMDNYLQSKIPRPIRESLIQDIKQYLINLY